MTWADTQATGWRKPFCIDFETCIIMYDNVGVSENNGTPKSSISIGFSIINHPFWGTPIVGNTHVCM